MSTPVNETLKHTTSPNDKKAAGVKPDRTRLVYTVYALVLLVSISTWFVAIGSPLWLDETANYWMIDKGFWHIWGRLSILASPLYNYILWLTTRVTGTSEIGMRIPSVLAMLGAVYVFYLCARHLFKRETALVATVIFCVNPIVIAESIDARPYAFLVLTTNAAILVLLRLRKSNSLWLAALFGLLSALILYFHFLGAAVLPALLLCFILWKYRDGKVFWQQLGMGLVVFVLAFLPLVPNVLAMFSTARTHVFQHAPSPDLLVWMFLPGYFLFVFALVTSILTAALTIRTSPKLRIHRWQIPFCFSLALIPVFILYGISAATPIHMFTSRHELTAVPGISLCWALALSLYRSRIVRLTFCITLVCLTAGFYFTSPAARQHGYSWKLAVAAAEKNASTSNAPVLVCSDFPESNYVAMPLHSAKESRYFSPLAYYKLSVPVVPLPRALNAEAKQVGSAFLKQATRKHERFLAMGFEYSYKTLDWLKQQAKAHYLVHRLGIYDGVKVLEFQPRPSVIAIK